MNWYRFFQAKKPMFLLFNLMSKKEGDNKYSKNRIHCQ